MGLDINILSVPRVVATNPTDAYIGSRYDKKPKWKQVTYERNDWGLHTQLMQLYYSRGGAQDTFNNVTVRLYKRDLRLLNDSMVAPILEHMKQGRVVYAESSF
jgi:hypothetical protein